MEQNNIPNHRQICPKTFPVCPHTNTYIVSAPPPPFSCPEVYIRICSEISLLSNLKLESTVVRYHKACYKSYTSKQNIKPYTKVETSDISFDNVTSTSTSTHTSAPSDNSATPYTPVVKRSEWNGYMFCKLKSNEKMTKTFIYEVVTSERAKRILDRDIEYLVSHEYFFQNAVYHSSCIREYLLHLKVSKVNLPNEDDLSEYDQHLRN